MKNVSILFQAPLLFKSPSSGGVGEAWGWGRKTILSLLLVMAVQFANGQKTNWSLQNCFDAGLENNIAIKIQKLEVKRIQKSRVSMLNELLPTVNLSGSQSYNFGSTIDPGTNARVSSNIQFDNFFMNAQMNLLDFGAIANSQKAKIAVELAKAEQEIIENEYKLQILESFYQAFYTQELVEIQREQLVNTQFNLIRVSKEIEIGSKPKSDLYDIQFAFAQEEKQLMETQQLYNIQKMQLFQLLNYETAATENCILVNDVLNVENKTKNIGNPKIKAARLAFESTKKELNFQRSRNLPTFSSFYQLSSFYFKPLNQPDAIVDNFSNQLANNKNQALGLQLSIPVFNGFKNNKSIISAKIETEKSMLKMEQELVKLKQQLEFENRIQDNQLIIQGKLKEVLAFAQASFKTSQAKFASGSVDAFSFSMAKNNLLTSEYDLLKNKLHREFTSYKISLLQGNSL